MLFRPALTDLCNGQEPGKSLPHRELDFTGNHTLFSAFAFECAKSCVTTARELLDLIHHTHQTNLTGAWWYNGLCKSFEER
jgi:hypothetical protein